jgi:malyl-CoA/(S)-citramalyl-CoA lyase
MSFKIIEQARARLNRSELAVPGSEPRFFERAASSDADVVFLDLEDAVAPDDKEQARKNVIKALNEIDWGDKTMSVRINGLDTHFMYRDVVDVVEQAGERLDMIMIPKVGTAADIYAVDMMVTQIEDAKSYKKRIGFEHIIETALGMQNVHEIAAASPRNESLHFGVADYAASTRARTTNIGGVNPDYSVLTDPDRAGEREVHWGDMWHYAIARMVVAARANGLRPIDGPFGDFSDPDGYRAAARRAAALGIEGKWAIHPNQVSLANEVFTPTKEETTKAKRIIAAMKQALREGKGAVALDGRLIDIASVRQAEVMVTKAKLISGRGRKSKGAAPRK